MHGSLGNVAGGGHPHLPGSVCHGLRGRGSRGYLFERVPPAHPRDGSLSNVSGGGHPHLPGSACHGLRGRQRGGQRGNVCTTVFSSPLVGWISEYIGLIIPFAVFEDLPGSVCLWQRGRQGGGRRKPVTDGFPPASGKGVTGEPVTGSACLGLRCRLVPPAPTT